MKGYYIYKGHALKMQSPVITLVERLGDVANVEKDLLIRLSNLFVMHEKILGLESLIMLARFPRWGLDLPARVPGGKIRMEVERFRGRRGVLSGWEEG